MNFGGAVATSGGLIFIAATADEKIRAFEKHSGRTLWEFQLPAGGYATPSVYMIDGRQYVAIAAGGSGKNGTKSGDAVIAFALPEEKEEATLLSRSNTRGSNSEWIELFDGKTLNGWVQMNGAHTFVVEDGAIVGRTVESSARINSFLCSLQEFDDFELELETYIDPVTNSGIQVRTKVRPIQGSGSANQFGGRVNGPQMEIRRYYPGQPTTGVLYGEAIGTGWLSSQQKIDEGHRHYVDEGWNKLRIVAQGPRIQTFVNGHLIEDLTNEEVYKTHAKGFIGLQVHGISERELSLPVHAGSGITKSQPLIVKWRNIRVRPLSAND
jgi:quinoprotein glucose dehydrogenase